MDSRTVIVTFATPSHYRFQDEFDRLYRKDFTIFNFSSENIERTDYYKEHMDLFRYKKYFGYFLWKPYIIKTAFSLFPDAENIIYADTNIRFSDIKGFKDTFDNWINRRGYFLVRHIHHLNSTWTKRDTFIGMNADNNKFWNARQVWSVLFGFNRKNLDFVNEYQRFCEIPELVTEEPNKYGFPNLVDYREHRWEQSVLSILAESKNIEGPLDVDMFRLYNKVYDDELYKLKAEINKDPLAVKE